jgi:hypothetical protein
MNAGAPSFMTGEFLPQLKNYQLLKEVNITWSQFTVRKE